MGVPGSAQMLAGLTRFEPSERWSVSTAMTSSMFDAYKSDGEGGKAAAKAAATLRFVDYLDAPADGA